jgi:hypothetical protein
LWGILPMGVSLLVIFLELLLPASRAVPARVEVPSRAEEHFVA